MKYYQEFPVCAEMLLYIFQLFAVPELFLLISLSGE